MPTPTVDHRRADSRPHTAISWLDSRHSFSFGNHYDPAVTGHGLLIVSNEDRVAPGGGFGTHGHRDMEIVTWVLDGALEHRDSAGNEGVIVPGLAQRMSAGSGIMHSEMNHSRTEPVRFIQMWIPPDTAGIEPGYEQRDVSDRLEAGGLVAVASGRGHDGAVHIHQRDAVMWVARMTAGDTVTLPEAPWLHLFAAVGSVTSSGIELAEGDALRLTDAGALDVTAVTDAEIIVWESHAQVRR